MFMSRGVMFVLQHSSTNQSVGASYELTILLMARSEDALVQFKSSFKLKSERTVLSKHQDVATSWRWEAACRFAADRSPSMVDDFLSHVHCPNF